MTPVPPDAGPWVRLTRARHQPEADLIVNMLADVGITAFQRRAQGFDVPDFLATGPRDVMVRAADIDDARAQLTPPEDGV